MLVLTIANLDLDMGVALGDILDASYYFRHASKVGLLYIAFVPYLANTGLLEAQSTDDGTSSNARR